MKNTMIWGETYLIGTHFEALLDKGPDSESHTKYTLEQFDWCFKSLFLNNFASKTQILYLDFKSIHG